jgi:hypothetical protein
MGGFCAGLGRQGSMKPFRQEGRKLHHNMAYTYGTGAGEWSRLESSRLRRCVYNGEIASPVPAFSGPNKTGTASFAILGTTRQASTFCHDYSTHGRSSGMSRARILTLSCVAAITLGSGALAQGGGGSGGGAGGGASSAGGAAGGSGAGSAAGASGAHGAAGASGTPGTGNPNSPVSVQPPGSTGQNTINSPGTGAGPGPNPAPPNK